MKRHPLQCLVSHCCYVGQHKSPVIGHLRSSLQGTNVPLNPFSSRGACEAKGRHVCLRSWPVGKWGNTGLFSNGHMADSHNKIK